MRHFRPGDVVDGRFVLERVAGAGAHGAVWRAVDVARRDPVALKLVPRPGHADGDPIAGVASELDALTSVHHDAVVGCRAFGRADEDTAYLALTWIDGESLAARIARRPLSAAHALILGRRIVDGLAAIHGAGLIHGDLKPGNVLCPGGDPTAAIVVDLGVARPGAANSTVLPVLTEGAGTPAYMPPEQIRGDLALDARADLYALGCVLYEALAGRPPFTGDSMTAVLTQVLFGAPPPLAEQRPDVPPALTALIGELLAKDRDGRPADAAAVRARLDAIEAPAGDAPIAVGGEEVRPLSVVVMPCAGDPRLHAMAVRRVLGAGARVGLLDDGVVVAFDGSIATDRAIAAARAAAALQAAVDGAIGVATGAGVIRDDATGGDAVEAARRLATGAPGVWLDEATAELIGPRFEIGGETAGRRLGAERRADGQRTVLGRVTPLVGRDRELAMLIAVADECVVESAPRIALVVAPPGLGKSRLRRELVHRLGAAIPQSFTVWAGRADPVSAGAPLATLADLVRASLSPDAIELDRRSLRVLASRGDLADGPRVADFLGELLGLPCDDPPSPQLAAARGDPILMNDQLRRAFVDWAGAATGGPLALVLEDFHWGDATTLRFVEGAMRQLRDRPLLVVVVGRPGLLELTAGTFAAHHPLTVRLGPLPARAAGQLIRHALDGVSDELVERVVARAAGNPFFVEELIRQVAAGRDDLPASVVSMVQARLDDLAPAERRVLRAASVLGARFTRAGVAALLGRPSADGDLEAQLAALVRRELLIHRRPSPLPADDELGFAHDLVREAADALLTDDDRAAAHRAAAAWGEQRAGADPVALATHWERGGAPGRAATWHRRSAEVALAANDFAAALAALRHADQLGAPPSAVCDLIAAEAHGWRGDLPAAAAHADAATCHSTPVEAAWWRGLGLAVTTRGRLGDHEAVLALAARAREHEPPIGAVPAYLSCLAQVSRQLFHAARYADAEDAIALVIDHAGDLDELPPLAAAHLHGLLAAAARHRGDLAGDLRGYRAVLAAFEAAGDLRNTCNTRVSVAFALIELGDWDPAERELEAALVVAERLGLAPVATRARQNLGLIWLNRGRLAEAAAVLDRVIAESREQDNSRFEGWTRVYRARVALATGDTATAFAHARAARVLLDPSPPALVGARAVLAQTLAAMGRVGEAVDDARDAVATVEALGGVEEFEALARLALAEVLDAAGDIAERDLAIARAVERLTERAAAIGDELLQRRFLEDVGENRRTLELAARWLAA